MKHFLTQILCGAVLALGGAGIAGAAEKAVVVISADGSQRQELLTNVERIEIGKNSVTVKTAGGDAWSGAFDEIDRILIGAEYSAVQQITSPGDIAVWPAVTSGYLNVSGLHNGDTIRVYDLNGVLCVSATANDGLTTVDLSPIPAGAYIVATGRNSVKIIKK